MLFNNNKKEKDKYAHKNLSSTPNDFTCDYVISIKKKNIQKDTLKNTTDFNYYEMLV